jgi:orotidine-5'-phosphate decarboxylase
MQLQVLVQQIRTKNSYLCVGLDTDLSKIPAHLLSQPNPILAFNKAIIDATKDYCVSYKINTAFYEVLGAKGWELMQETFDYIPSTHLKIADAKRGDIGNTSHQYARAFFEVLKADAVTVAPYMGEDSVRPFLEYKGKWTIVLGLTSNKGSNDFQRLQLQESTELYEKVLATIAGWGTPENLMFVTGATQAGAFVNIRRIVPENFLLVPGVGVQGGSLAEVSRFGINANVGLLVNASRAVIYASSGEDFAEAAAIESRRYADEMAEFLSFK